jgi:glycosyltransferase involved in cell wall biosynthesis
LGDGPLKPALVQQAQKAGLENIHFLDPVAAERVPEWMSSADIAIVPLKMYIPGAVPSKLYEAMSAGLPVVMVGSGEPAEIVRRHESGLVVEPGDIDGLAGALRRMAAEPGLRLQLGSNGREAAERHYCRDIINGQFVDFLEQQLLGGDGRASRTL